MKTPEKLPEVFLHYVWENQLLNKSNLKTTAGNSLEIIDFGRRNPDSGPDFFNAKIKIDKTIWAGNVEIHRNSSDWIRHGHARDEAYNNIILHVVETDDAPPNRRDGSPIPTLIMSYPEYLRDNYQGLLNSKNWIACQNKLYKFDPLLLKLGFNRLMIERLETKTEEILKRLKSNNNDWSETFYQLLAKMFGFKVNSVPFELLAKSIPLHILLKHKDNLLQLEAILFGNSGLLNKELLGDDYYLKLRDEYSFFYKKYKLRGIESHLWKFMRLRPGNFPTIRISQFASLIHSSSSIFSKLITLNNYKDLKKQLKVSASQYWHSHYNFNKLSKGRSKKEMGDASINALILNVVVPFLFVYGESQNKHHLKQQALDLLVQIPAESNTIIKKWQKLGVEPNSAFESQALLQLKNVYCEKKKCLNCQIGVKLVKIEAD